LYLWLRKFGKHMKIKKDDKVKVIAGKDKGKTGKVLKVFLSKGKVVVEGVNIIKKAVKPGKVSNVMLVDQKSGDPIRVGYKIIDGKKYRINKKSGEVIEVKKGK